jgi:hypothetical protein
MKRTDTIKKYAIGMIALVGLVSWIYLNAHHYSNPSADVSAPYEEQLSSGLETGKRMPEAKLLEKLLELGRRFLPY